MACCHDTHKETALQLKETQSFILHKRNEAESNHAAEQLMGSSLAQEFELNFSDSILESTAEVAIECIKPFVFLFSYPLPYSMDHFHFPPL